MSQVGRHQSQQEGNTTRHPTTLDKIHSFSWSGVRKDNSEANNNRGGLHSECVFTNPVNRDTEFALTKYERSRQ